MLRVYWRSFCFLSCRRYRNVSLQVIQQRWCVRTSSIVIKVLSCVLNVNDHPRLSSTVLTAPCSIEADTWISHRFNLFFFLAFQSYSWESGSKCFIITFLHLSALHHSRIQTKKRSTPSVSSQAPGANLRQFHRNVRRWPSCPLGNYRLSDWSAKFTQVLRELQLWLPKSTTGRDN